MEFTPIAEAQPSLAASAANLSKILQTTKHNCPSIANFAYFESQIAYFESQTTKKRARTEKIRALIVRIFMVYP